MTEHEIAVGDAHILERAHRAVEHVVARSRRRPRGAEDNGPDTEAKLSDLGSGSLQFGHAGRRDEQGQEGVLVVL